MNTERKYDAPSPLLVDMFKRGRRAADGATWISVALTGRAQRAPLSCRADLEEFFTAVSKCGGCVARVDDVPILDFDGVPTHATPREFAGALCVLARELGPRGNAEAKHLAITSARAIGGPEPLVVHGALEFGKDPDTCYALVTSLKSLTEVQLKRIGRDARGNWTYAVSSAPAGYDLRVNDRVFVERARCKGRDAAGAGIFQDVTSPPRRARGGRRKRERKAAYEARRSGAAMASLSRPASKTRRNGALTERVAERRTREAALGAANPDPRDCGYESERECEESFHVSLDKVSSTARHERDEKVVDIARTLASPEMEEGSARGVELRTTGADSWVALTETDEIA